MKNRWDYKHLFTKEELIKLQKIEARLYEMIIEKERENCKGADI